MTRPSYWSIQKNNGERFTDFQVVNNQNDGFGAGHDVAIRQASTQFVLVSNIDIKFLEDSIPNVVQSAQNDLRSASWELRQMPYEHPKFVIPRLRFDFKRKIYRRRWI